MCFSLKDVVTDFTSAIFCTSTIIFKIGTLNLRSVFVCDLTAMLFCSFFPQMQEIDSTIVEVTGSLGTTLSNFPHHTDYMQVHVLKEVIYVEFLR